MSPSALVRPPSSRSFPCDPANTASHRTSACCTRRVGNQMEHASPKSLLRTVSAASVWKPTTALSLNPVNALELSSLSTRIACVNGSEPSQIRMRPRSHANFARPTTTTIRNRIRGLNAPNCWLAGRRRRGESCCIWHWSALRCSCWGG